MVLSGPRLRAGRLEPSEACEVSPGELISNPPPCPFFSFLCERLTRGRSCTAKTFSDALWCAEGTVQSGDAAIVARWVRRGVDPLGDYHRGRPPGRWTGKLSAGKGTADSWSREGRSSCVQSGFGVCRSCCAKACKANLSGMHAAICTVMSSKHIQNK